MCQPSTSVSAIRVRLITAAVFGLAASALPVAAQPPARPLATRELDVEGVVAEVIESVRKDNVLTVRVRFRNTGDHPVRLELTRTNNYDSSYIADGDTKLNLLRNAKTNKVAATPMDRLGMVAPTIKPKATWIWWGKFPAPAADHKKYTLYLKVGPPIEDVPIIDR